MVSDGDDEAPGGSQYNPLEQASWNRGIVDKAIYQMNAYLRRYISGGLFLLFLGEKIPYLSLCRLFDMVEGTQRFLS